MERDNVENNAQKRGCACFSLILVFIVLSIVDTIPAYWLCISHEIQVRSVRVGKKIPNLFPVLVVSPTGKDGRLVPAIVFYSKLESYLKAHPNYSFTLPANQVKQVNSDLKRYTYDSGYGVGRFTMTQRDGKQFFKVEGTWDDDRVNIGWYEAEKRSFIPKRHVWFFGPGLVMMYFPIIVLGNIFASFLIVKLVPVITHRISEKRNSTSI